MTVNGNLVPQRCFRCPTQNPNLTSSKIHLKQRVEYVLLTGAGIRCESACNSEILFIAKYVDFFAPNFFTKPFLGDWPEM